jgi:hypothetical protein
MAILGFNDCLQFGAGALDPWDAAPSISVGPSSGGSAVGAAPVTNLLTRPIGSVWQRTGIAFSGSVQLRLQLGYVPVHPTALTNFGALGFVGIRQTPQTKAQGLEQDLNFRVRISNSAFESGSLYDQTRTFHAQDSARLFPRQLWFDLVAGDNDPALSSTGGNPAITPPPSGTTLYVTVDISRARTFTETWSVQISRMLCMTTMVGRFEPTPGRSFEDSTETIRSFGGQPYSLRGAPMRRIRGALISLPDQAVTGAAEYEVDSTRPWPASIAAANLLAGSRGEVVLIPQVYGKTPRTADSGTRYPSAWQTQPVFGLLDSGIEARREATTSLSPAPSTPNGSLWRAEFAITEIPLVI